MNINYKYFESVLYNHLHVDEIERQNFFRLTNTSNLRINYSTEIAKIIKLLNNE